jgi:hypothetical protein
VPIIGCEKKTALLTTVCFKLRVSLTGEFYEKLTPSDVLPTRATLKCHKKNSILKSLHLEQKSSQHNDTKLNL